jgi:hypothetical protein
MASGGRSLSLVVLAKPVAPLDVARRPRVPCQNDAVTPLSVAAAFSKR